MDAVLGPLVRFLEVLPESGDLELGMLKCHLVIEEVLSKLIANNVNKPEYVKNARLTFFQKAHIARSVNKNHIDNWVWPALDKLNNVRNAVGHGLSTQKFEATLKVFADYVFENSDMYSSVKGSGKFTRFHIASLSVYSALSVAADFDPLSIRMPSLLERGATALKKD